MATLLGHLARFGSFSIQGEVLCTQGLTYLLREHGAARLAFADELAAVAGVTVSHELTWHAEQRQPDGGRPDLEGQIGATPFVKIEAKLDARLDPEQFRSYASHLQERLQSQRLDDILLVLVPALRTNEATAVVRRAFGFDGPAPWRARQEGFPDIAITVISWDDVLATLRRVESEEFRSELEQFEGMYRELRSSYIAPLAGRAALVDWRNHEDDFVKLVDRVTRRLTTEHHVYPMGIEPPEQDSVGLEPRGYNRRYVCRRLGDVESCFSIGVRDPFEASDTPIWLRFDRRTGSFPEIHRRLQSSDLASKLVSSGGHIWIPLEAPFGADAEQMVNALVEQAVAVRQIAYQPTP